MLGRLQNKQPIQVIRVRHTYDMNGDTILNEEPAVEMMAQVDPADIPTRRADNIAAYREVLEEGDRIRDVRVFFVNTKIPMSSIIVWDGDRYTIRASFEWIVRPRNDFSQVIGVKEKT